MADTSTAALCEAVKGFLAGADLTTVNKKKVREHLNQKFNYDFSSRKQEIDKILMDALTEAAENNQDTTKDSDQSDQWDEDDSSKKRGRKPATKKRPKDSESEDDDDGDDDDDSDDGHKKKKRASNGAAKGRKPSGGGGGGGGKGGKTTGYLKKLKLSPDLAEVMGEDHMARNEVVKKMYAIVKERDLLDPKNRQFAILDAQLQKVFGQKRIRMFGMMKLLGKHFSASD